MAHLIIIELVVILAVGLISFILLLQKSRSIPKSIRHIFPLSLLLYNLWIAVWLIRDYFMLLSLPGISKTVDFQILLALSFSVQVFGFGWLYSYVFLVHKLIESKISLHLKKAVVILSSIILFILFVGWLLRAINNDDWLFRLIHLYIHDYFYIVSFVISFYFYLSTRILSDEQFKKVLSSLALAYTIFFSLLLVIFILTKYFNAIEKITFGTVDVSLKLFYNLITILWITRHLKKYSLVSIQPTFEMNNRFEETAKKYKISKRESEIIKLIGEGKTNQQIADILFISLQTVKDHNFSIFRKTGVKNRTALAKLFSYSNSFEHDE